MMYSEKLIIMIMIIGLFNFENKDNEYILPVFLKTKPLTNKAINFLNEIIFKEQL